MLREDEKTTRNLVAATGVNMEVQAISVRQPWANLIASGKKSIETRRWSTNHRGLLLIASSKLPRIAPAGFAVAIARLDTCRAMTREDEREACCPPYDGAFRLGVARCTPDRALPRSGRTGPFLRYAAQCCRRLVGRARNLSVVVDQASSRCPKLPIGRAEEGA